MADETSIWEDRDEDFESEETNEESTDLTLTENDFVNLVVAPADWTIGTLYTQIGKQIDLDPDFQRRNVWSPQSKSRFIESLFLGIPIPQILLSSKPSKKSSFLVLDGKQRLLTIKEFIDGHFNNKRRFKLKGLRVLKSLEGKSWSQIEQDPDWSGRLMNETQRTTVLRGWDTDQVLYEIFFRLNSGSVKLSPMELRMSLFPGPFLKFIIAWTETIGPLHHLLKKRQPDSRMADVELAVRLLAFQDSGIEYAGDLKRFLDEVCNLYNAVFNDEDQKQITTDNLERMNKAIQVGIDIFGVNRFCRKFGAKGYETRFNRAIFDVMVGALYIDDFRLWATNNPEPVKQCFEEISLTDGFQRAVETTTKSITSTRDRFKIAFGRFSAASGVDLTVPNIALAVQPL